MTVDELRRECEAEMCPNWVPPKVKDAVWDKAWQDGHASGAAEVRWHYDEIMGIVRLFAPTGREGDEA